MKGEKYSNKNVFVLPSYIGIPYILRNFRLKDPENVFLTNNPSLHKWLTSLNLEVILTPRFSNDLSRQAIRNLKEKNIDITNSFHSCTFYYFFYLSNIPMLHLLKILSKTNELIYIELDPILPKTYLWNLRNIAEIKKMGIAKLAFGSILNLWPDIYKIDRGAMFGKKFKNARKQENLISKPILSENYSLLEFSIHPEPIDILYIDNVSAHFPDIARYISVILKKLQNSGRTVHIKPHPTFQPIDEFKSFPLIRTEIPSEICMYSAKLTLGVSSTSLNEPVDTKVISLLNLIELPVSTRIRLKKILKSEQIIFVDSEERLFDLINQPKLQNES